MAVKKPLPSLSTETTEPEASPFEPIRLLEVEISQPLPTVAAIDPLTSRTYCKGLALVRFHTQPLGLIDVHLDADGLSAASYAAQIWNALRPEIIEHLRQDGLPEVGGLTVAGLPGAGTPPCLQARAVFLADPPFVSVIIPTRERPHQLASSLRSVLDLDYPRSCYEVIVVDNAPQTSATAEVVAQIRQSCGDWPQVRYIREDRPGRARACNRGLTMAQGKIVAFTDDDVVVDAHWLAELVRGFDAAKSVAGVTGWVVPLELETPAQRYFEQLTRYPSGLTPRMFDLAEHRSSRTLYPYSPGVFGGGGNNMAFRRSILDVIGDFDPALGTGTPAPAGEDIDLLLRAVLRGHTIVYQPAALVHHQHRREYAALCSQIYGYAVGTTAFQFKTMLVNPHLVPDFAAKLSKSLLQLVLRLVDLRTGVARKLLKGLLWPIDPHRLVNPRPRNHLQGQSDYSSELTWLQVRGLLYGPLAYIRSHRQFDRSMPLASGSEGS